MLPEIWRIPSSLSHAHSFAHFPTVQCVLTPPSNPFTSRQSSSLQVKVSGGDAILLRGASKRLRKDFDVWPGEVLLLELVKKKAPTFSVNEKDAKIDAEEAVSTDAPTADQSNADAAAAAAAAAADPDCNDDGDFSGSEIMASFAAAQNTITLRFNHPDADSSANADAAATFELQV